MEDQAQKRNGSQKPVTRCGRTGLWVPTFVGMKSESPHALPDISNNVGCVKLFMRALLRSHL
jgi:hypothetical protein